MSHDDLRAQVTNIWLDFQQMRRFEDEPLIVTGGHGIFAHTSDGRKLLDAISGAAVTGLGYNNRNVQEAMKQQIDQYLFWPPLHATNGPALNLAKRIVGLLPGDFSRAFLLSGGSEATECAIKMARQYHLQSGNPRKYKIIGRYWGYHGSTMGALSASGVRDKSPFEPFLPGFVHVPPPYPYRCPNNHPDSDTCCIGGVEQFEQAIRYENPGSVAAVIVDPVMAAAGILVPSAAYYRRLREICDRYNVLLIFDEVLTGFGRLGEWFAANHYDVTPDIICLGKGISSGFIPLAAVVARGHVADAFEGEPEDGLAFMHGNTFGGHPLAAATGLAVIDELERADLITQARVNGARLGKGLRSLQDKFGCIGDVRGLGMLWGIEFVRDRSTKELFARQAAVAPEVVTRALGEQNMILRSNLHILQVSPPLITSAAEVDEIVRRLDGAITATLERR